LLRRRWGKVVSSTAYLSGPINEPQRKHHAGPPWPIRSRDCTLQARTGRTLRFAQALESASISPTKRTHVFRAVAGVACSLPSAKPTG
jgi:hypothetical protein